MNIIPSEKDIDQLLNRCVENEEAGIEYLLYGEKPFN